ncbi:hypothetical protein CW318_09975 [Staphylococcus aureus]|nr:hypothetical protein CW318_09975 [Staphylococcus aureus]QOE19526.1 hypothetical protein D3W48_10005 [Staphylococcus aureus]
MRAPPQLAHYCKLTESQLLCWGPAPTCIVCRISFRNSLCWGPPTCIVCRIFFRNSLCWGPTRIEKSLLQAYFLSVNYCQYNIVVPRTLNL